nr:MAG TPA: hypothetical protein [Caudoviricetes sp.]
MSSAKHRVHFKLAIVFGDCLSQHKHQILARIVLCWVGLQPFFISI